MAAPYRATVTIDGEKFEALSAAVSFDTLKDHSQMPEMGSLKTTVQVLVDMHDTTNMPFSLVSKLFDLANVVTTQKIKAIKIEFWKDDSHEDALCSYSFNGWLSKFETSNPMPESSPQAGTGSTSPWSTINSLMILHLEPVMNQANFSEIAISN
jgi:hypothetical protein